MEKCLAGKMQALSGFIEYLEEDKDKLERLCLAGNHFSLAEWELVHSSLSSLSRLKMLDLSHCVS